MTHILSAFLFAACSTVPQPIDPAAQLVEAHMDLARSKMEARSTGEICDTGAYREDVIDSLAAALFLEPALRDTIQADVAFDALRDDLGFRLIIDGIPRYPIAIKERMTGITVHGPTLDTVGSLENLAFESGSVVRLRQLVDAEAAVWSEQTGDWWVEEREVVVRLDSGEEFRLVVQPDATLWQDGDPMWFPGVFECGAPDVSPSRSSRKTASSGARRFRWGLLMESAEPMHNRQIVGLSGASG